MKFTENECISFQTQEEFDRIIKKFNLQNLKENRAFYEEIVLYPLEKIYGSLEFAERMEYTIHKAKDILSETSKASEYPKKMYVWDDEFKKGREGKVYGMFKGQYMIKYPNGTYTSYKNAKNIVPKLTRKEIADKFGVDEFEIID